MTYRELSDAWDIYSNRYAESKYRTLQYFDEYEKSLFLTQSADEIVKEMLPNYDRNEKIKKQLLPITNSATVNIDNSVSSDLKMNQSTIMYVIPSDVLYVVMEYLKKSNGVVIDVIKPLSDDESSYSLDSPFRAPTRRPYAYRNSLSVGDVKYTEVITNVDPSTLPVYFLRYVRNVPPFIVTEDLMDAKICGISTNSNLDDQAPLEMLHNKILNRAIEIAYSSRIDDINVKLNRQKDSDES